MAHALRLSACLLAVALVAGACAWDEQADEAADQTVRVFSVYRGGTAAAFRLVLEDFTARTGIPTSYVGSAGFADNIRERVREGDPPDVALFPQPAILAEMARAGFLAALPGEAAAKVRSSYSPAALELGTVDGVIYGAWFRLNVKSLVWYRPDIFAEQGYEIPATWNELRDLETQARRDGFAPWCLGIEAFAATGWAGTDWIEDLVLRLHGPEAYDAWTAGTIAFTDDRIRAAFEKFDEIALTPGQVSGGARGILSIPALRAIDQTFKNPPDCLLTRQGSFQANSLSADVTVGPQGDIDVFVLPSMGDGPAPILASGTVAAAFNDSAETIALMEFLASPEAGEAWAAVGGYNSPHLNFDPTAHATGLGARLADLIQQAEVVRFDGSDLMPPSVGTGTFWEGMIDYVAGTPLDAVLENIQAGYSTDSR